MRLVAALVVAVALQAQGAPAPVPLSVSSPDGSIVATIDTSGRLAYRVAVDGRDVVAPSPIGMTLQGGDVLGASPVVIRSGTRQEDRILRPVVRIKREQVVDRFRELRVEFRGNYALVVRAYDDGVAYRFVTSRPGELVVESEQASFEFGGNPLLYFPEDTSFISHQERPYKRVRLTDIKPGAFAYPPVLVAPEIGPKIAITESDLLDYPGMSLAREGGGLAGLFPNYPLTTEMERDRTERVTAREPWIARTRGTREFPWRVIAVARKDTDLLETDIVYRLASEPVVSDTSWIRAGKVAWDWWNFNNVYGVPFRAGVNTDTYTHYIDFAAENGIEYVILDEGWYTLGDLTSVVPAIDMAAIAAHARSQNVGLIMWVVWKTLDQQMDVALDQFVKWGVKGIKVDFMQRDDQWMVNFYERVAREAARRHLLVDFHGAYKPTGLYRTYPNVLTSEGVQGLEQDKWSKDVTPDHDVTFPFLRMMAGPVDYTPGGMLNATKADFQPVFNRPMTQGTRCHQLAMYVVYESPLQMLADAPSNYRREPESLAFLSRVPVTWDETRVLDAKVGEYILVARRHGAEWYVGAMTSWTPRQLEVDLGFLGDGQWAAEVYRDGPNADRAAVDYVRETQRVTRSQRLRIQLAPGGGWVARLTPAR
jgi:alpha-glucosidase